MRHNDRSAIREGRNVRTDRCPFERGTSSSTCKTKRIKVHGSECRISVRVSVTPRTDDRCPGRARTRPCPSFLQHYALRTKLESPAVSACAPHARLGSRVCVSSTSTRSCTLPPAPSPGGTRGTLNKIAPASATPTLNRSFALANGDEMTDVPSRTRVAFLPALPHVRSVLSLS